MGTFHIMEDTFDYYMNTIDINFRVLYKAIFLAKSNPTAPGKQ